MWGNSMVWEYCMDAEDYNQALEYGRILLKDGYIDYRIREEYGWYIVEGLQPD